MGIPGAPPGFYKQGSLDGSRPGIFFTNIANYKTQPKYEIMRWNYNILLTMIELSLCFSLCLHEGSPGHHFQLSLLSEQKDLPLFRKTVESTKYTQIPSRCPNLQTPETKG